MSRFSLFNQRLCVLVFIQRVVQRFLSELQFLPRQNVEKDKSEKNNVEPTEKKKELFTDASHTNSLMAKRPKKKKKSRQILVLL